MEDGWSLRKLNTCLCDDPAIWLLGMCPAEMCSQDHQSNLFKNNHRSTLHNEQNWNQPKCSSTVEWMILVYSLTQWNGMRTLCNSTQPHECILQAERGQGKKEYIRYDSICHVQKQAKLTIVLEAVTLGGSNDWTGPEEGSWALGVRAFVPPASHYMDVLISSSYMLVIYTHFCLLYFNKTYFKNLP